MKKALLLFSGGQDSAICLAWALSRFDEVMTVGFEYGQRHDVEMTARQKIREKIVEQFPQWAPRLKEDDVLDLAALGQISETAMTRDQEIIVDAQGLPNTFVPGRNLAFMVFAAALAWRRNIDTLIGGMCETDFSGYPDCREDTLRAQLHALNLGMGRDYEFETPLMHLTKAQSWQLCYELGGDRLVGLVREYSHTCYKGVREILHDWGYGCAECPACELRAEGWQDYQNMIVKS